MAKFTLAQLPAWANKVQKVTDAIVGQAASDLLADIKVDGGITRTGSRVRGAVPRDTGALALSLQSSLYGSTSISAGGEESAVLVAGQMRAGDVGRFAWGGPAAPYAAAVHYGANGVTGTFWIDDAKTRWVPTVNAAVARVRAELQ